MNREAIEAYAKEVMPLPVSAMRWEGNIFQIALDARKVGGAPLDQCAVAISVESDETDASMKFKIDDRRKDVLKRIEPDALASSWPEIIENCLKDLRTSELHIIPADCKQDAQDIAEKLVLSSARTADERFSFIKGEVDRRFGHDKKAHTKTA